MKKTLSLILSLIMIITAIMALPFSAQALETSGKCGTNATYKFNKSTGVLVISGKGEIEDNCPEFQNEQSIKSVTVESGITAIGLLAFNNCENLTSVKLPASLKTIDNASFRCTGLTKISIPSGVTTIGAIAFENCEKLTSVVIPANVTSIGDEAFSGCCKLTSIKVNAKNTVYDSRNNCNAIINKKDARLIAGCQNSTIPSGVKIIGSCAFYGSKGLSKITIPNTVVKIETYAFGATDLKSVTIPDSVKTIDEYVFFNCKQLYYAKLSGSMTELANRVFNGCYGLQNVVIPVSIRKIYEQGCPSGKQIINLWYGCTKANYKKISLKSYEGDSHKFKENSWKGKNVINHFAYKSHKHKWVTTSTTATFKKSGKKNVKCSVCGMVNKKIPGGKLVSPTITKITKGKKSFKVKWKKSATVAGYQIQYSTTKSFKKKKTVTIKGATKSTRTVKKLKAKKKYYVRVRAYKTINKKRTYSKWSAAKAIKTK